MAEKLLYGRDSIDAGGPAGLGGDLLLVEDFLATADAVGTRIEYYSISGGVIHAVAYEGGSLGDNNASLIQALNAQSVSGSTWNSVSFTPFNITSGNYYRIGGVGGGANRLARTASGPASVEYRNDAYSGFTASDPIGTTSLGPTLSMYIGMWGWDLPVVSSIDDDTIVSGQSFVLTGTDFMTDSNPITVEICNNSTYASATVKTVQTVTAQSDTEVTFTAVTTGLTETNYVFVTTDLGLLNVTGLEVQLGREVWAFVEDENGIINTTGHPVILT